MDNMVDLGRESIESLAKRYVKDYRKKYIEIRKGTYEDVSFGEFLDLLCYYPIHEGKTLKSPVTVCWDVTAKCNLSCVHCFGGERSNKVGKLQLNPEACEEIIHQLSEANVLNIIIGGGEPFARKDLLYLIERIKNHDIGVEILTNGTLLNKDDIIKLEDILRLDHDRVQVSLDGPSSKIHNEQRGTMCFDKALRGIKLLSESDITTMLKMTVTDVNYKHIIETYELAQDLGVDVFATAEVCNVGKAEDLPEIPEVRKLLKSSLELVERTLQGESPIYMDGLSSFMANYPELRQYLPRKTPPQKPLVKCPAGTAECTIDYKGDVYPCAFLQDDRFKSGNVLDRDIREIWKTAEAFKLLREGRDFSEVKCSECDFLHFCRGGCPGSAYAEFGTINAPDPSCMYGPK